MKKVDEDLLKETEELTHTKYDDKVTWYDLTYDLIEEVKYWKKRCNELENSSLEDFNDPRYEYGF